MTPVHVIGGGLAGSEAAWQIARAGVPAVLHEMRPERPTEVHRTDGLAELVCSNSFRSDDAGSSAIGLLHEEMRRLSSVILAAADANKVPAGGALAVDRDGFSDAVGAAIAAEPLIRIERGEIAGLPPEDWTNAIVATGPLTSPPLAEAIRALTGEDSLAFFDAIAPIVYRESIDFDIAWFQSRYDKAGPAGTGSDYINCPMDEAQYESFIDALLTAEKTEFKDWERDTPYFEGCLPIEVTRDPVPQEPDRLAGTPAQLVEAIARYRAAGFAVAHLGVRDGLTEPFTAAQLEEAWAAFRRLPKPVLVHCSAGHDRTGRVDPGSAPAEERRRAQHQAKPCELVCEVLRPLDEVQALPSG